MTSIHIMERLDEGIGERRLCETWQQKDCRKLLQKRKGKTFVIRKCFYIFLSIFEKPCESRIFSQGWLSY